MTDTPKRFSPLTYIDVAIRNCERRIERAEARCAELPLAAAAYEDALAAEYDLLDRLYTKRKDVLLNETPNQEAHP